ncbi:MAG: ATPase [Spirochaetales bacterium]|nr:ATPase [Candidatus Physcosoma equi]
MKKVTVLTQSGKKNQLILALRDFGMVHIDGILQKSEASEALEKKQNDVKKVLGILEGYVDKKNPVSQVELASDKLEEVVSALLKNADEETKLNERNRVLNAEADRIRLFGDFDPNEVKLLKEQGIELNFYLVGKKELKTLSQMEDVKFVRVKAEGKIDAIAVVGGKIPQEVPAQEFVLPTVSLGTIEAEVKVNNKREEELKKIFKDSVSYMDALKSFLKTNDEAILFEKVTATAEDADAISYITGYVPAVQQEAFKAFCKENKLAYLMDDPTEEENPPTQLRHKGIVRIIQPLFDVLGLVPGYREKDISKWFLAFMTIFFAMIIGDGGYGLLFVILAGALMAKSKKISDTSALVMVFGVATVIWGAITGTWFGSQAILEKVKFLQFLVIPGITNFPTLFHMDANEVQNNMMTLCFSLGTIHLSLACVICVLEKLPKKDLSLFADLGWLINTVLLYLLALYLVIGTAVPFNIIVVGVAIGFLLVCCFAEQAPGKPFVKGLTQSLGGFFTTFINTISCFSNVMSYIRLFAVGMASLAIAQSFNGMAAGMFHGITIPMGVLVIVLGHAVNIVMGFLSIIVHGVRLNIMEFSGQVGVEWSGYKYEPFKKVN